MKELKSSDVNSIVPSIMNNTAVCGAIPVMAVGCCTIPVLANSKSVQLTLMVWTCN